MKESKIRNKIEKEEKLTKKNRLLKILEQNKRGIIFFISMWAFLIIVKNIFEQDINAFDNYIYGIIKNIITPRLTLFFTIVTHIASAGVLITITVLALIFLTKKRYAYFIAYNLIFSSLLNHILKTIFTRERPTINRLIEETGYSFPSGHSTVSMAFYGFLIYLVFLKMENKVVKSIIIFLLGLLIILIGFSRIYLGVHYPSDVCGGFLLSIAYLTLFTKLVKTIDNNLEEKEDK